MKAKVKTNLNYIFDDRRLNKGDVIEVEPFSYGLWYKIVEPQPCEGITIHIDDLELWPDESQVYGMDCPQCD